MNKILVFLDAGHGGLIGGKYVTAGKRSPFFQDKTQLFEGVYNREIVSLIAKKLNDLNIEYYIVSAPNADNSLENRIDFANAKWNEKGKPKSIYVSIHGDAAGDGVNWHPASGISVYTSKGQTKSDIFASILIDKLDDVITGVKWRTDETDQDPDKEENFFVLKETMMAAVLSENGFMTNAFECARMLTSEWKNLIAEAHVNAIISFSNL